MSDILPINRPMRRNNIAQDAPGTIFSRGPLLWHPLFSTTRIVDGAFSRFNVMGTFRAMEDGGDAAVPVDAKERAHKGLGKLHKPQFSTASTPIIFSFDEDRQITKTAASAPIGLSQQRGSPQQTVPKTVPTLMCEWTLVPWIRDF